MSKTWKLINSELAVHHEAMHIAVKECIRLKNEHVEESLEPKEQSVFMFIDELAPNLARLRKIRHLGMQHEYSSEMFNLYGKLLASISVHTEDEDINFKELKKICKDCPYINISKDTLLTIIRCEVRYGKK